MIKVLQISKYYDPYIGGIEQVAKDIANAMAACPEIQQKIICFNEDVLNKKHPCRRNETVTDIVNGVEVVRCGCFAKVSSQALSVTYAEQLRKLMDEFRPDVVIFHYPNPFVAHLLLKYKNRPFKLILYWHLDITKQKILGKLFHGQNLRLIERADYIWGATPKHVDESAYSRYFEGKKVIMPYAIDEKSLQISQEEIRQAEAIRQKYAGNILCFFIGRHVPYKGLKYLIEASGHLQDEHIKFFIAGQGELTDELKAQADHDPKVEFVGRISEAERRAYLYACDIFCFPSITRNEAFGLALAEGMYFEKPAVTFTIPGSGVNYVNLNGVTGIECPNSDSKAYAEALKILANDPVLRKTYGKNARKRVLDNFTFGAFEKNLIEELKQMVQK